MDLTLQRLIAHAALRSQLIESKEILRSLWDRAQPGAQVITGMPRGTGTYDKVGNLATDIAFIESKIEELEAEVKLDETDVVSFIESINDIQTAICFRLRYLRCFAWKDVADAIGGQNTEAGVKALCYRYLEKSATL